VEAKRISLERELLDLEGRKGRGGGREMNFLGELELTRLIVLGPEGAAAEEEQRISFCISYTITCI